MMIDLASPKWQELEHAYGSAGDIPALLKALESFPPYKNYQSEPYFSLWSALCHQGDVYTASYAAVPHIVRAAKREPARARQDFLLLPASIDIARSEGRGPSLPTDLTDAYRAAIEQLPELVALMRPTALEKDFSIAAAAGVSVAFGDTTLAKAVMELSSDVLPDFFGWLSSR